MKSMRLKSNQKVLVLGLARSGEAVARLLLRHGCQVTINERRERESSHEVDDLERLGASLVFGGHPLSLLDAAPDYIVKNPGIPYSVPLLVQARQRDIPIYTEIEVASWLATSPLIAITGSNGKTTTTTLVGEMLAEAQMNPMVAGNIGTVLSSVIESVRADQPIVLEVSSFQLMGTESFHPTVAALLNLYPAHLDYHETYEAYAEAKWSIFQNMGASDTVVLNYDQSAVREQGQRLLPKVLWFSKGTLELAGAFIQDGHIMYRDGESTRFIVAVDAVAMKGEHNLENALAATAIAMAAGATPEVVAHVLTRFRGVEHRQEFVRTLDGVDYYNDSKATNPTSALRALKLFPANVVWIAGGLQRGDDFSGLVDDVHAKVKAAILLGQSADAIQAMCEQAGVAEIERVASLEQAVQVAHRTAAPGDIVLLSPACASWDMFASFEERGRMFKEAVHTL
jgi:UDP-N-acetylmuramoylalanine--D-glutamate ligase